MRRPFVTLITQHATFAVPRRVAFLFVLALTLGLTGCADMNPFASSPNPEAAVYSQFSDIPVPKDMSTNASRTFVNYGQDGTKVGLETLEGRIPSLTLTRVMINNMLRDGWAIRTTASGSSRYMQLYERENRYAVIYYYDQTASYAMEIWVGIRLADGAVPPPPPLDPALAPGASTSGSAHSVPVYHGNSGGDGMNSAPVPPAGGGNTSGGVQERSLP
ncbi:MAG: hypothetical protein RRY29_00100 [Desulfovibrionaceae bacterium]